MTTVKEVLAAVKESMASDAEASAIDMMLYGRSIYAVTPEGMVRVPPEEWPHLADDIVLPRKKNGAVKWESLKPS